MSPGQGAKMQCRSLRSPLPPLGRTQWSRTTCGAIARQKQLKWQQADPSNPPTVTSGSRQRRDERVLQENAAERATQTSLYVDGVSCYKIMVIRNKEPAVADDLEGLIRKLEIRDDNEALKKSRYVSAWIPRKRIRVVTPRCPKGMRKMVKYGPAGGEIVFLTCQMNDQVRDVVINHPHVQRFAHRNPTDSSVPMPCPAVEIQDAFDWMYVDELRTKEKQIKHMIDQNPARTEPLEKDMVFEVDKLVTKHIPGQGLVTLIDDSIQISNENGHDWEEKKTRLDKLIRKIERQRRRKEGRTDNRPLRNVRERDVAREQQRAIEEDDDSATEWYEQTIDDRTSQKGETERQNLSDVFNEDASSTLSTKAKSKPRVIESIKAPSMDDLDDSTLFTLDEASDELPLEMIASVDDQSTATKQEQIEIGQKVVAVEGAYANYSGIVKSIDDNAITVAIDVFGTIAETRFRPEALKVQD